MESSAVRRSRREFLSLSLMGLGLLSVPTTFAQGMGSGPRVPAAPDSAAGARPKPPPLPPDLVKEFVGAAHGNLDRTRELLGNEPGLLNATWDWKAGDFETALGGAGHMGRRDIALHLLENGARIDLFVAAMLGEMAIVKAVLDAHPRMVESRGPHGITLMKHALAGGKEAAGVVAYLESLPVTAR